MKYDDVLKLLGEFGLYQKWLYFMLCLPIVTCAMHVMSTVFVLGVPEHRCALPDMVNDTFEIQSEYHRQLVNASIPLDDGKLSKCQLQGKMYTKNDTTNGTWHIHSCKKWVYSSKVFQTTFATQDNLVCKKKGQRTHAVMAFMAGFTAGALALGIVADALGRKKGLLISLALHIVPNIALTFVSDFVAYLFLRFLSGTSVGGLLAITFVMSMELVGPSKRIWAGIVIEFFWAFGAMLLALLAYLIRDWRYLNLAVSIPTLIYIPYICIIPESARWLLTKGRDEEAEAVMRKIANVNKVDLPEKLFDYETFDSEKCVPLWKICVEPKLVFRCLIIFLNWMVVSMVFYGLGLNVGNLSGDIYINFFLSSVAELVGFALCLILLNRMGRKPVYIGSIMCGGIACILTIFPVLYGSEDIQWTTVGLSIIGKIGSSTAFAAIYLFSAELFPTIVRNSAIGASSFCARVGGLISPYVATINDVIDGNIGTAAPLVLFGLAALLAGLLALILPETKGHGLPESIEDSIHYGKKRVSRERRRTTSDRESLQSLKQKDNILPSVKISLEDVLWCFRLKRKQLCHDVSEGIEYDVHEDHVI